MKSAVWSEDEMAIIQNKDRLLPSQPYFSKMYKGKDFYGDMEKSLGSMYEPLALDIQTKNGMTYAVMGSDLNTLRFYQMMINLKRYKSVLELGAYIGVSAMYLAATGANVTTIEMGKEFFTIAIRNIITNGFQHKIDLHNDNAITFLENATGLYDFIFIDCAKESYKELLELSLQRLSPNGMILVDDVFFQGDTLNNIPTTEKGKGVKAMLNYASTLNGYEKVILPLGNGVLMVRKI